jgi:hypothetical protein
MKKHFLSFLLSITVTISFSQNKFQQTFSQNGNDFNDLNSVQKVSDGYIMVGSSGSTSSSLNDITVMKVDPDMSIKWAKSYGNSAFDEKIEYFGKAAVYETDGILILGNTTSAGNRDFMLLKVDYSGALLWSKSYSATIGGNNYNDYATTICKTSNGYYLTGYLNTATTLYALIIKVDLTGTIVWSKYFVPSSGTTGTLASATSLKSGDLVVGGSYSPGGGASESYLARISSTGSLNWMKGFSQGNYDNMHDIAEDSNNTVLVAMMQDGYFSGARSALLNIDAANGTVVWGKAYDLDAVNDRDGQMVSVMKNPDNTTMVCFIYSNTAAGSFKSEIAVAHLDATGNMIWAKKYGTQYGDAWPKIYPNSGSYLVCAESADNRYPSQWFYLLGLNSDGTSGCNESVLNPTVSNFTGYTWNAITGNMQPLTSTATVQSLTTSTVTMTKTALCINTGISGHSTMPEIKFLYHAGDEELIIQADINIHTVSLVNASGQLLRTFAGTNSIDLSNLSPGIYFARINDEFMLKFFKD